MDDLEPMMRQVVLELDRLAEGVAKQDGLLPSEVVRLAQAVSDARAALYAELLRQGWVAPAAVPSDLARDGRLRGELLGGAYDLPVPLSS